MSGVSALREIGELEYESVEHPEAQSPRSVITYGGSLLALCINAAYQTVTIKNDKMPAIYSVMGHYLGGGRVGSPVRLKVTLLRDTRTFATRLILMSQTIDGVDRICLSCTVDFIYQSPTPQQISTYWRAPSREVTHHSKLLEAEKHLEQDVKEGSISQKAADAWRRWFGHRFTRLVLKPTPEGIAYYKWNGMVQRRKTGQEPLHVTERRDFDWFKPREALQYSAQAQNGALLPPTALAATAAFVAYELDAYLPALPLFFQTHTLADTASSSALDFALRFHQPNLNPDAWFLREFTSDVSADERSYAQAHLWQEESDGSLSLIATMSQACILRGKPPSQGKL